MKMLRKKKPTETTTTFLLHTSEEKKFVCSFFCAHSQENIPQMQHKT